MSTEIHITKAQLEKLLKSDLDQLLEKTVAAVNSAPAGHIIDGSEEQVRLASAEFREKLFEKAIQGLTKAADAAFSGCANIFGQPYLSSSSSPGLTG